MNIDSLSGSGGVDVRDSVGIAVAKQAQSAAKREGQAMVEMIQAAADVVKSSGSGRVDVYA